MKKNRVLGGIVVAIFAIFGLFTQKANATDQVGFCGENVTYQIQGDVLKISGSGDMYDYDKPEDSPFYCIPCKVIEIGDGVTSIGKYAFSGNACLCEYNGELDSCMHRQISEVEKVIIGESVESIGDYAFKSLGTLREVEGGDNLINIGSFAFYGCNQLSGFYSSVSTGWLGIPRKVESIGDYAFVYCISIKSVSIPESVSQLGTNVFDGCIALNTVEWSSKLETLPDGTFFNCKKLTSVTSVLENITKIGDNSFKNCETLNITIPNNVIEIGDSAFYNSGIIRLNESLKKIGGYAFAYSRANWFTIPATIEYVGGGAFMNCPNNVNVNWDGAADIPIYAFYGSNKLESVNIKDGANSVGDYAFNSCPMLANITIPDSVTCIGNGAFNNDVTLSKIKISCYVSSVGLNAFNGNNTIIECYDNSYIKQYAERNEIRTISLGVYNCENDKKSHVYSEIISPKPTCTEKGILTRTCSVCGNSSQTIIDAVGHDYNNSGFRWSEDGKNCKAVYICVNDITHTVEYDCDITSVVIKESTCTEAGITRYTAIYEEYTDTKDVKDVKAIGHDYKNPEFKWSEGGKNCKVVYTCANDITHTVEYDCRMSYEILKEATCTETGMIRYIATYGSDIDTKDVITKETGHDYKKPEFLWSEDGKNCKVVYTCANDITHTVEYDCRISYEILKEATCTEVGTTRYIAIYGSDTDTKDVKDIKVIGHDYKNPEFKWSEDGKNCKVVYTCANDITHTVEYDCDITSVVIKEATCTEAGITRYTAIYEEYTDTKDVKDVKATGHDYKNPEFRWSEDGKNCKIVYACVNGITHTVEYDCRIFYEILKEATCTEVGTTRYIAIYGSDTDTKDVKDIKVTGHKYKKPEFKWSEDGKNCKVIYTCANNIMHTVEYDCRISYEILKEATCTGVGTTRYIAIYGSDTDTKDVKDIKATGHNYIKPEFKWSEDGKKCKVVYTCANDITHKVEYDCRISYEILKEATCTEVGTTRYIASYGGNTDTKDIRDIPIDKENHRGSSKKIITKATTKEDGKIETKCSVCGNVTSSTIIYRPKTIKLSATSYTYNGQVKKPTVIVKDSKGKTISSKYYTVSYASGRKNVGKYNVKVKFYGKYSGTKTLSFKINPVKTSLLSVHAGTKAFTAKWSKKTTQVTGYQIQYSRSSTFKSGNKIVTVTSAKTVSKTIKNLLAKKKYYVRIRTYKSVGSTKYYSAWSAKKYVSTK